MNRTPWTDHLPDLLAALGQTVWMTAWAFVLTLAFGLAAGVALRLTAPDGLTPRPAFHRGFGAIVNLTRSLPFLILIIVLVPFTRLVVGTAYGPTAAIVPLAIGAIPFYARVVESALQEVAPGKIEAVQSMGATTWQIVRTVLVPEALPGLVSGGTLTLVTLIGYSTMAGAIGGGGLGDFAIRFGYQRFEPMLLLASVVVLVVLVQLVQSIGDAIVRSMSHRRG